MRARLLVSIVSLALFTTSTATALAQPESADRSAQRRRGPSDEEVARARTLFQEGIRDYDAGRLREALEKMREAYRITRTPELAFNVGRVYERIGENAQAIRHFEIYLREARPTPQERADIELRIRNMRELMQRQRDQVFTAPPSQDELTAEARRFFLRGVQMFRRRRYEAAMQAFTAAHRFAPLPEVLYNMAVTAERLNNKRDAIDYYREYLRVRRDAPDRAQVEAHVAELRRQGS